MGFQRMNRKGLQLVLAFYAVLAVSMVIIGVGVVIEDWNSAYDAGLTYDLQDFDRLDDTYSEARGQEGTISPEGVDPGSSFEDTTFRGVFGIINSIYKPFRVVFGNGGMIDAVTERFGIPDYIRQTIVAMMVFAITFAIVAIIFRLPGGRT